MHLKKVWNIYAEIFSRQTNVVVSFLWASFLLIQVLWLFDFQNQCALIKGIVKHPVKWPKDRRWIISSPKNKTQSTNHQVSYHLNVDCWSLLMVGPLFPLRCLSFMNECLGPECTLHTSDLVVFIRWENSINNALLVSKELTCGSRISQFMIKMSIIDRVLMILNVLQDMPLGLMDDIYLWCKNFSIRIDEVEEVND